MIPSGTRSVTGADDAIDLLNAIDLPVILVGATGLVTDVNEAAAALDVRPDAIGRPPSQIPVLSALRDVDQLCLDAVVDGIGCRRDIRHGDRSYFLRIAPCHSSTGRIGGAVITVTNMTAFRASIEQAIYDREFTKAILNTVSQPIAVLDPDLVIETANRAFYVLFGTTREAAQGVPLSSIGPADWNGAAVWGRLRAAALQGTAFEPEEIDCDFPARGSRTFWLEARRLPQAAAAQTLLVLHDITDLKQTEAGLRNAEEALRAADHRKDVFLATLAHELRNPLAPIRNGLELIRLAADNRETVDKSRMMIERQVSQMVRLVDDLLDVSRISRGRIDLRRQPVELTEVLELAIETSRPLIEARGHELTVTLPPEPIALDADVARLAQVFANLLNNAAKYSDRGGQILLTVRRDDHQVEISIRDSGVGIPPRLLPTLFELFSQVDSSLERSAGGLGIGLALAKGIVELHGGTIEGRSDGLGRGSTFVVRLPIRDEGRGTGDGGRG